MKRYLAIAGLICAGSSSADAQSLMDNIRGLKQTMNTLAGKRSKAESVTPSGNAVLPGQSAAEDADDLVPSSSLAVDASDSKIATTLLIRGNPSTFDVLGFKLGMSPREVQRVAKQKHVVAAGGRYTTGSFEVEATRLANASLSKPIIERSQSYWRKGAGRVGDVADILIDTDLEPIGPTVNLVHYRTKLEGQTPEQFKAAVIAEYGPPTFVEPNIQRLTWCASKAECESVSKNLPYLTMTIDGEYGGLSLSRGYSYFKQSEDRLKSRALAIRSATGKKADF